MATIPVTSTSTMSFDDAMVAIGMTPYREQSVMARSMTRIEAAGLVGFIEAPTATGKTHVMAHRAIDTAIATARPVVIAVPTIEIAHQTLGTVNDMTRACEAYRGIRPRIVLGRQEFVSLAALDDIMQTASPDATAAVGAWIAAHGPGPRDGYPAYTVRGLEHALDVAGVAMTIPLSIALGPGEATTEPGLAYGTQFDEGADVLIVTHAMLARDLITRFIATNRARRVQGMNLDAEPDPQKRWLLANDQRREVETGDEGRLPDYRRLVVDEAHLLRDNIEGAMTTGIAINPLIRHVAALAAGSSAAVPAGTLTRLKKIKTDLSNHALKSAGESLIINWNDHRGLGDIVERLAEEVSRIKTGKTAAELKGDAIAVDRARYALNESLRARNHVRTKVEWSPVAAFPSIVVGRNFLGSELRMLWDRLESATLISATLYTENIAGPSMRHSAARLFVPEDRQMSFRPIEADWLREPVTAWLPENASAARLIPDDGQGRADWIEALVEHISTTESLCDGTLVLSTSRSLTHDVAVGLARIIGEDRVIDGSSMRLSAGRARYVSDQRAGRRPVWLSQGPAWTGLDLPDESIDTLFITRLPYPRPEAEDTSGARTQIYGATQVSAMMMTLKQGIGRLVRIRGARPKRMIMLDGRILDGKRSKGALALIGKYRIETF